MGPRDFKRPRLFLLGRRPYFSRLVESHDSGPSAFPWRCYSRLKHNSQLVLNSLPASLHDGQNVAVDDALS